MNVELEQIKKSLGTLPQENQIHLVPVYPGIELFYLTLVEESFSMQHKPICHILQINYCKTGQAVWTMENGNRIYLNPGNFSLHTMDTCANSVITFPTKLYQGLTLCVDLQETSIHPPELLQDTDIFKGLLREKFCRNNTAIFLAGNEQTESIFSHFYNQTENLRLPYQRIKVLELLLYLAGVKLTPQNQLTEYQAEQIEIVRKVHDWLLRHIEQRITIEKISRQYLINPTTLKAAFKSVYGTSLAAHIKEHRMKQAAKMLKETDMSIAEIAQAVGYDSQSKFSAAFKACFQVLPREYRRHQ